jgi:hypothetical protein
MENIIKKIELDIDGVNIVLTPEQAKKLHAALGELMGAQETVKHVHHYEHRPYVNSWVWPYGSTTVYAGGLNNTNGTAPMFYNNGTAKLLV